ncbi:hypothetical protein MTR_4g125630 [Medicago truncatula]|uniref:Uncharacterized protein n=1 Tax=Medicago truncatula TaxID=3880 RepID=A0A072USZ5_MEDTR|nr:hypothetical protein MTR_4g125630 [Medicago truncatula]
MDPKRVEDLVYVHINLRLLSRKEDGYKKGQSRMWDIGGDAHEPLDGVGIEQKGVNSRDSIKLVNVIIDV